GMGNQPEPNPEPEPDPEPEPVPDRTPPTAPSNLRLVSKTATSVVMAWNAAADPSGIAVYDIYMNSHFVGEHKSGASLQFTATNLWPNTAYTFTVRAQDGAGNWGPDSNPLAVKTDSLPEPKP